MKLHEAITLVLMNPMRVALYHPDEKRLYMHGLYRVELFDGKCIRDDNVFCPLLRVDGRFVTCKQCVEFFDVEDILFDGWAVVLCDLRNVKEDYCVTDTITMWATERDVEALGRVLTHYSPRDIFYHHAKRSEK